MTLDFKIRLLYQPKNLTQCSIKKIEKADIFVFLNIYRFQGMNSASLCSLAGRYDNPIPPWFLAPIDSLKILAP